MSNDIESVPTHRPPQRRLPLALRTYLQILGAALLLGVGALGLRIHQYENAIGVIRRAGGTVDRFPGRPPGSRARWPDWYFEICEPVHRVSLKGTRISDADLTVFRTLTDVQHLDLSDTAMSDAGLLHLDLLTNLYSLQLGRTQVTDAGLNHISRQSDLRSVSLNGTGVTPAGIEALRRSLPAVELTE